MPDEPRRQGDAEELSAKPVAGAGGEGEPAAPCPSSDELLAQKQAEVDDLRQQMLYLRAEFENFSKRTEKRYREATEYAAEPLLRGLLPVLDNLERAVGHGREAGAAGHEALLEGLGHVIQQFAEVLLGHGVSIVEAEGERFDPGVHEALAQVPGEENGRVGGVYEKGYTFKGRLLRPAKVTVTRVAPEGGDG